MKRIQGTVKLPYYKIERRMSKTQTWIYSQKHKREEPVHGTTPYPPNTCLLYTSDAADE